MKILIPMLTLLPKKRHRLKNFKSSKRLSNMEVREKIIASISKPSTNFAEQE
jgi:hypothetical protein